CGHDGHTTMLLGAALALAAAPHFDGTVYFIFQPDEENGTGADAMIDDGLFERFPMSAVFGLHNLPGLPVGAFGIQDGPFCTFEDNFEIRIDGRGGHASMPEQAIDPIVVGAEIVTALQTIVARSVPPRDHAVVSVTDFETDGARNVLASQVRLVGDCRGFDLATSTLIKDRMAQLVAGICSAHGAKHALHYSTSFVPLVNHAAETQLCVKAVGDMPGASIQYPFGRVGFSEDFAKMLQHCPGAYILMGNGTQAHAGRPLHNPGYDFNDAAISVGVDYWCSLVRRALSAPSITSIAR
ncbi:MAG: amidohydrolase, partial [Myxococcota bacterium]